MSAQIDAARAGDERAFAALVAPFRRELHVHCYRITGSLDDADDVLQNVLLAAWTGLPTFTERSSLRTWLYRIATTRSLNAVRDRSRRPTIAPSPPFEPPAPTDSFDLPHLQPYPEHLLEDLDPAQRVVARESIELAFVAALQDRSPRQLAALIFCDVLDFTLSEAATMLDTTTTATKGLLQRARATMPPTRADPPSRSHARLARTFAAAFAHDDVDTIVELLTDRAWLAMPPARQRYDGKDAIGAFLRASAAGRPGGRYVLIEAPAIGRVSFACYLDGVARGLVVIEPTADGTRIASILRFLDDDLHRHFHLPDRVSR
ncbi:MAG: RNA polymerase subunit sigma-70 [Actinobacteria bacterium]|nr:RNA polymerase subunit sigma-70 [Actinomycetota bacterium]